MPRNTPRSPGSMRSSLSVMLVVLLVACADAQSPRAREENGVSFTSIDASGAVAGAALPAEAAVHVTTPGGSHVAGTQVEFSVAAGGGAVIDTIVTTDADGRAGTTWLLGPDIGAQRLIARAAGAEGLLEVSAGRPRSGSTYEGRAGYVVYIPGDLPIILSAPHGGEMRPAEIPDRTWGTTVRDVNTEELTLAIADALEERTGARPHVVLVRLHRTKLDANREIDEAAQGNRFAERTWAEFHSFISGARAAAAAEHGAGFYIDVHGHAHAIERLELGYLVTDEQLQRSDAELDDMSIVRASSVRALVEHSPHSFSAVLRGPASLGALLESRGYAVVPGPSQPHSAGEPYFSGGPNARRHGSRDGGVISGMQLEAHRPGVRDSEENRIAFGRALAAALEEYVEVHLGIELSVAAAAAP